MLRGRLMQECAKPVTPAVDGDRRGGSSSMDAAVSSVRPQPWCS